MSTIFMMAPPCTLPIALASLGSINWLMTLREADMGRGSSGLGAPNSRRRKVSLVGIYLYSVLRLDLLLALLLPVSSSLYRPNHGVNNPGNPVRHSMIYKRISSAARVRLRRV